jgi:hypothetical protein
MAERFYEKFLATFFAENDYSRAMKLAFLILKNEKNPDDTTKEVLDQLEWIREHTSNKLDIPFYKAWNIVSLERNPKKLITIVRGHGIRSRNNEMTVGQIVVEVQTAHQKMYELMGKIASKYDISVPIVQSGADSNFVMPTLD